MLRVLFVDDDPLFLDVLRCRLASHRDRWDMVFAAGPDAALGELLVANFDVVVADVFMPDIDGPALLERVRDSAPRTGRVILTSGTDDETTARCGAIAHQILSKPAPLPFLEAAVEAASRLRASCPDSGVRRAIDSVEHLPTPPMLYLDLCRELDRDDVEISRVGAVVASDPGLVAHLLKVVNSAYFGLRKPVTDVNRAILCLGVSLLRGLVLKIEVERMTLGLLPQTRMVTETLHHHAQEVAMLSASLVPLRERGDAYTAGLLHDVGKLVLATRDAEGVLDVANEARRLGASEHCVERMRWGVSHAEVGALLLELWAIPPSIREAVLLHHEHPSPGAARTVCNVVALAEAMVEGRERGELNWSAHEVNGAASDGPAWAGLLERSFEASAFA